MATVSHEWVGLSALIVFRSMVPGALPPAGIGLPPIFDPLAMRVFRWFRGLGCGFGGRWKERSLAAAGADRKSVV